MTGTHKHKCPRANCGRVWRHPDGSDAAAHRCPACGTEEFFKYYGPEEPLDKERGIKAVSLPPMHATRDRASGWQATFAVGAIVALVMIATFAALGLTR